MRHELLSNHHPGVSVQWGSQWMKAIICYNKKEYGIKTQNTQNTFQIRKFESLEIYDFLDFSIFRIFNFKIFRNYKFYKIEISESLICLVGFGKT